MDFAFYQAPDDLFCTTAHQEMLYHLHQGVTVFRDERTWNLSSRLVYSCVVVAFLQCKSEVKTELKLSWETTRSHGPVMAVSGDTVIFPPLMHSLHTLCKTAISSVLKMNTKAHKLYFSQLEWAIATQSTGSLFLSYQKMMKMTTR